MHAEAALLRHHGHEVEVYERTNSEIGDLSPLSRANILLRAGWSQHSKDEVGRLLDRVKPDVMHVHNFWFLLTPSIFAAAKERGLPTVLTLHNYRMICPGVLFLRGNRPCERCLDGRPLRAIWHRCHSRSFVKSALSLGVNLSIRKRQFLTRWIDAYIALSSFAKDKFVTGGMPGHKIHVKPNFAAHPITSGPRKPVRRGALYVGRLSREKGIDVLLKAWRHITYPLTIVGDGPERAALIRRAPKNVVFTGQLDPRQVAAMMTRSAFMVFPSVSYEGFPLTIVEAMANGCPVIASALGARAEVVEENRTGLLFQSGNVPDLRNAVQRLVQDKELQTILSDGARRRYLDKYTPDANYHLLLAIYESALRESQQGFSQCRTHGRHSTAQAQI